MSKELTFKQAVMVSILPAAISALSAYYAQDAGSSAKKAEESAAKVELMQAVTRSRVTERDLINNEGIERKEIAYLIPVADNRAWAGYLHCRKKQGSRFDCAKDEKRIIPKDTPEIISTPLDGGY